MPERHKFTDFQACLNQEFSIEVSAGQWEPAKLIEARELEYTYSLPGESPFNAFSLIFSTGREVALAQKTYLLKHTELGELQIFLVPLEPDEGGARYEAVFS